MITRLPVEPAPGPLEEYAARFDDLFGTRAQREGFRRRYGIDPAPRMPEH